MICIREKSAKRPQSAVRQHFVRINQIIDDIGSLFSNDESERNICHSGIVENQGILMASEFLTRSPMSPSCLTDPGAAWVRLVCSKNKSMPYVLFLDAYPLDSDLSILDWTELFSG